MCEIGRGLYCTRAHLQPQTANSHTQIIEGFSIDFRCANLIFSVRDWLLMISILCTLNDLWSIFAHRKAFHSQKTKNYSCTPRTFSRNNNHFTHKNQFCRQKTIIVYWKSISQTENHFRTPKTVSCFCTKKAFTILYNLFSMNFHVVGDCSYVW